MWLTLHTSCEQNKWCLKPHKPFCYTLCLSYNPLLYAYAFSIEQPSCYRSVSVGPTEVIHTCSTKCVQTSKGDNYTAIVSLLAGISGVVTYVKCYNHLCREHGQSCRPKTSKQANKQTVGFISLVMKCDKITWYHVWLLFTSPLSCVCFSPFLLSYFLFRIYW